MSEITITKENVKKAWGEGCEDVKRTLERLFPDVFEEKQEFKVGDIVKLARDTHNRTINGLGIIKVLPDNQFVGVEFFDRQDNLHSLTGHAQLEHGWYCAIDCLKLVYRPL